MTASVESLFREEVVGYKRNQNYGSVFINLSFSYKLVTIIFGLITILIILFIIFAEYSEKYIVQGYLNSTKGVIGVYPQKNGVITRSKITVGEKVKKGDELFVIDTSQEGMSENHPLLEKLLNRKKIIDNEISYKVKQFKTLRPLLEKRYISQELYRAKHDEITALKNDKNLIETELIKYNQESTYFVRAPIDGIISSINYQTGQYANAMKPLLKIIPANDDLIAELYIPVPQSGFLNKHNKVIVRYHAYPYERFGSYSAIIDTINQSVLTDEEEEKPIRIGQPYYKIKAKLESQYVLVYGKRRKVQQGMTVSAVVIGAKRKIWQWMLDPLFSLSGAIRV